MSSATPRTTETVLAQWQSREKTLILVLAGAVLFNLYAGYGFWTDGRDAGSSAWNMLVWIPFNALATVAYLVLGSKLGKVCDGLAQSDGEARADNYKVKGAMLWLLCLGLAVGNWVAMLTA